jgi:hypothetical protein
MRKNEPKDPHFWILASVNEYLKRHPGISDNRLQSEVNKHAGRLKPHQPQK